MPWQRTAKRMPRGWARRRARILARDPVCRICGLRPATEVDHVISRAAGGDESPGNLRGVCRPCHARRTQRQSVAARKRNPKPPPLPAAERQARRAAKMGRPGEADFWREIQRRS